MNRTLFVVVVVSMIAGALSHGGYFGIGESSSEEKGGFRGPCMCSKNNTEYRRTRNPCANNTGVNNICGTSPTSYLSCNGADCSVANCSAGQLWNRTLKACVSCKTGYHIAANYPKCICDQGTTFNRSSQSCIACPANSVQLADACFCNVTGQYPYLTLSPFACNKCPGDYVTTNVSEGSIRRPKYVQYQVCRCPGANDIFNKRSVSCYTCQGGAKAVKTDYPSGSDFCQCSIRGQFYNTTANACACERDFVLNSAGTACVRAPRVPRTTTVKSSP